MTVGGGQRARIAQSVTELDRLEREIAAWIGTRRKGDQRRQYWTPLTTLERTLLGAVTAVREEAGSISPAEPLGTVHARCKATDQQAALIRQVWDWFKTKFDQRDDENLSGLLAAADEVVWSCYREAVQSAALRGTAAADRWPTPLPYIDPSGTVEAIVRDDPPTDLTAGPRHPAVRAFLTKLPVPVISLPAACLDAPWWLALLAHEVGHHLQHDLAADAALVREVGESIEQAVLGGPEPNGDAEPRASAAFDQAAAARWRRWSEEIFADACAVASTGTAAVTAIFQLELDTEGNLLKERKKYPQPVVRLALLAELATQLGLDGSSALDGLAPELLVAPREDDPLAAVRAVARADLAQVKKVAAAVLTTPLGGAGPLAGMFRFELADHRREVNTWADALRRGTARPAETLRAARDQIGGAVLAWRRVVEIADDTERAEALTALAAALPPLVAASRKPGTRAATPEEGPRDLSAELTAVLREAVPIPDTDPTSDLVGG